MQSFSVYLFSIFVIFCFVFVALEHRAPSALECVLTYVVLVTVPEAKITVLCFKTGILERVKKSVVEMD